MENCRSYFIGEPCSGLTRTERPDGSLAMPAMPILCVELITKKDVDSFIPRELHDSSH